VPNDPAAAVATLLRRPDGFLDAFSTAQPGHKYYEALRGAGLLAKCVCGQQKLGWQYPEFIVKIGEKVWSVGRDARSNAISCGPNGYHSARYGNEPVACY